MKRGNALDNAALFEHLQFCQRKMTKTAFKYPWEAGFLSQSSASQFNPGPIGMPPLVPTTVQDSSKVIEDVSECLFNSSCKSLLCKQPQISWEAKLDAQREVVLAKWLKILLCDPLSFEVSRAFFNSTKMGLHSGRLVDDLRNVFAGKGSSTLNNRVGPLLRYMAFCADKQLQAFPPSEAVVYSYMQSVEATSAPTFLRSFVSSISFCIHVLGMQSGCDVVASMRVKGLASKCYLNKRKTRARAPLTVYELTLLENIVLGQNGRPMADRHAAGCFLFMVYARARFSDMLNVSELTLETVKRGDDYVGYLEAEVARSKTSFSLQRKVRLLPMSACINGLVREPWGVAWYEVIAKSGVVIGKGRPLLPARTQDGWHTLPLSAEAATAWLRKMLQSGGRSDNSRLYSIGTHSCKATCLSWMSKWGVDPDVRRLMGYHVADKMSTMLIYGRDNTSSGLRILDSITEAIRTDTFRPDANRAGMFPERDVDEVPVQLSDSEGSSSEDSVDEDAPEHEANERAEQVALGPWDGGINLSLLPAGSMYFRHRLARTIHLTEDESGARFFCGRTVDHGYQQLPSRPQTLVPTCKQCFSRFKKS